MLFIHTLWHFPHLWFIHLALISPSFVFCYTAFLRYPSLISLFYIPLRWGGGWIIYSLPFPRPSIPLCILHSLFTFTFMLLFVDGDIVDWVLEAFDPSFVAPHWHYSPLYCYCYCPSYLHCVLMCSHLLLLLFPFTHLFVDWWGIHCCYYGDHLWPHIVLLCIVLLFLVFIWSTCFGWSLGDAWVGG